MISLPLCPHKSALLIDLLLQIVPQCVQPVHEVPLERIQRIVNHVHLIYRVLLVSFNVAIQGV